MSSNRHRQCGQALPPLKCNQLIENALDHDRSSTTIVICSSREEFLGGLQTSLESESTSEDAPKPGYSQLHPLLIPTIHRLAASKTVDVAFAPTVQHLRAYLATYSLREASLSGSVARTGPGINVPRLIIYGLLGLHRNTTEYSLQGLSRSLAIAVEAADTFGLRLILIERVEDSEPLDTDSMTDTDAVPSPNYWTEQVPLLNSSLALSSARAWAGRMVSVGSILARWCIIDS
ncbi:MAG: hypothetical protein Q9219_005779 [cf. Caloplaca sp. 3 TL-2023]